jgi:hypothetical protein
MMGMISISISGQSAASGRRSHSAIGSKVNILVPIELADGKTASRRKAANCVGGPRFHIGHVIESQNVPVCSGDEEITILAREAADRSAHMAPLRNPLLGGMGGGGFTGVVAIGEDGDVTNA